MDLVRLAMPRRVYTQAHADYVIETFAEVLKVKDLLRGFALANSPTTLRHFTAKLSPIEG
jgi:tryptophanase